MRADIALYLTSRYRRDILHESVEVVMPAPDPEVLAAAKAEIARIDALRLGANLANRDFESYQRRRALKALVEQLEKEAGIIAT